MKKGLFFFLILLYFSTITSAQTVTLTANPTTVNLSTSPQAVLTGTISGSTFTTASTSWADPGSGVSVGATAFSSGNTVATATATFTSTGARTFTLNYRRSGSTSNLTSTVNVNVVDLDISPASAQTLKAGSYIDFDYATRTGFPSGGSYTYSWQITKSGGLNAGDISYINSTSSANSSPNIQFNTTGAYSVSLIVSKNGVSTTSPVTVVNVYSVNAGASQIIVSPTSSVSLSGSASGPAITSYKWTKQSGPASGTITNSTAAGTTVTGLAQGSYTFRLTINNIASLYDDVDVEVNGPLAVSAGSDQTITLPSPLTLTGSASEGLPTYTYEWSKVSGPAASITTPGTASTTVTNLTDGTYVFQLKVTDAAGTSKTDQVAVTVYPVAPTTKPFSTPIYSSNFKGGHTIFGNTIMAAYSSGNGNNGGTINTSATDNHANMQFVNVDYAAGNAQVTSASSATLKLPNGTNTIKFARLYWGGRMTNTEIQGGGNYTSFRSVKIRKGTSGAYTTLNVPLSQVNKASVNGSNPAATAYQAWADVTSFIQNNGAGTYTVADIAASVGQTSDQYGNYAGWSIVVVYENPALDYYATRIYDAFIQVDNGASQIVTLSGFDAPANALQKSEAYLTAFTWEGDAGYDGDYLEINSITFSNTVNPGNNMWNGTVSEEVGANNASLVTTKSPNLSTSLAVDIDQVLVGTGYGINPNATSVQVKFGTDQDQYFPSILAFSMKVKDPLLTITKKAVNASNQEVISLTANQTLTYVISGKNTGTGDATNTIVLDSLPAGLTYVPGSIQIVKSGTNGVTGNMTDANSDDKALYVAAAGGRKAYIKFFVGGGATSIVGGTLKTNDEYEVQFKAATSANVNELTVINFGYISTFSNALSQTVTLQATSALSGPQDRPLSISLLSFSASKQNSDALLKWTTESEKDNDHFDVERSTDGVHFAKVGEVSGSHTTSIKQNYQFSDPLIGLSDVVYYRLKDVDIYGKGTYSKIVALRLNGASDMKTSVFPNPFTDNLKISIESGKHGTAIVKIISMNGQEVVNRRISLQPGQNVIVLSDLQKISTGVHLLQVSTDDEIISQKIIKK